MTKERAADSATEGPRWPRVRLRVGLVAATALIIVALAGSTLVALTTDYARVTQTTAQAAQTLSHTLREHAKRTFGEVDRVLANLAGAVALLRAEGETERALRPLHHMSAGLDQTDSVVITDSHGRVLAATTPLPTATAGALADALTRAPIHGLSIRYLGTGSAGPRRPGAVIMARAITDAEDGRLQGWAVAVLSQDYFDAFYQAVDMGPEGLVAVIHANGPVLFRAPALPGAIGTYVSSRPLFTRHLVEAPEGTFRIRTGTDEVERIQAYARVDGVPLVVLVGITTEHAFAAWQRRALWLGSLTAIAALVVLILAALLYRQLCSLQRSERRTREVEIHLSRAQAIAHVGSWEWNLRTNRMWWSRELHRIFDIAEGDEPPSYGRFLQSVHPDDRAAVASAVARALDDGQSFSLDYRVQRADGGERHVRHEGQCELDSRGHVTRMDSVVQDNTESTLLQAQLAQAGKLSTLGEMAAGMAHELSQPLNILRMSAEGALLRMADAPTSATAGREALQQVAEQADRMARIIDHIRLFSRKDTAPTQVFDARVPVRLAAEMMDNQLAAAGIRLDLDLPAGSAPVKGRPVQLEQVIVNLLANAKDSIKERRARDRAADGAVTIGHVALRMRRLGNAIEITVQDDGLGVPPGLFGRIFEPFFTTKGVGEGTGLGLSVSYGIITGMGGTLAATNRPGGGACFDISLPLQVGSVVAPRGEAPVAAAAPVPTREARAGVVAPLHPAPVPGHAPATAAPHVRLVEDEAPTLVAMRGHVETQGYRVSTASGGDQAWRRFLADPADLVVTDLRMADGDGEQLIRRLREIDPFLPIVVVSGTSGAELLQYGPQDPNTRVLPKPLSLRALSETVGDLLRHIA